jgi:adenosylcobinamide kinase / adenosylcobinamide-phosphate guanylyltransferase
VARRLILILGGARSGKSTLAERLAAELAPEGRVLFAATAQGGDEEMRERIAEHRRRRPAAWRTVEAPLDLAAGIAESVSDAQVVLVDCVTLWASNLLLDGGKEDETVPPEVEARALAAVDDLLAVYRSGKATYLLVSNEVGLGLVPPYSLGRAYRDLLGRMNQRLAAAADEVYLLVAGIPLELKALARSILLP